MCEGMGGKGCYAAVAHQPAKFCVRVQFVCRLRHPQNSHCCCRDLYYLGPCVTVALIHSEISPFSPLTPATPKITGTSTCMYPLLNAGHQAVQEPVTLRCCRNNSPSLSSFPCKMAFPLNLCVIFCFHHKITWPLRRCDAQRQWTMCLVGPKDISSLFTRSSNASCRPPYRTYCSRFTPLTESTS
jgi:hypothetical protein